MTPFQRYAPGDAVHCRDAWRKGFRSLAIGSLCMVLATAATAPLHAGVILIWLGGTGNWNDNNWDKLKLPGSDDIVKIDGGLSVASVVTVTTAENVGDLFISTGDTLNIANAGKLTFFATAGVGTIENNGLFTLNSSGNSTDISLKNGTFTFSGTGTLTLSNNTSNRILGNSSTDELINASGHTIQGAGQIGVNIDRKSTRLNSSHLKLSRMPSSA